MLHTPKYQTFTSVLKGRLELFISSYCQTLLTHKVDLSEVPDAQAAMKSVFDTITGRLFS
jgi:hypothetical protein